VNGLMFGGRYLVGNDRLTVSSDGNDFIDD
jgi:hypothetical protein